MFRSSGEFGAATRELEAERPARFHQRSSQTEDIGVIGQRIYSGSPYEEKAGYARAVVIDDWVLVSGTTGFDPDTKEFPKDVEAQCENCFRNISRALEQAGASLEDLVRVLIFVTSQEEFERIMPIIRKHCYAARPANTTVFAQLVAPHMRVEVEVMAKKRQKS